MALGNKYESGRFSGLNVLLQNSQDNDIQSVNSNSNTENVMQIDVSFLHKGKYQPRKEFDQIKLNELADSIKLQGIIQPIIVRKNDENSYEIIAGERRFLAGKIAGLSSVPCIVKQISDKEAIAIALIENLQRDDLNIMEEAEGLLRIKNEFNVTQDELSEVIGKSRASIANTLRLNDLHDEVKNLLRTSELEMGHARALLPLDKDKQGEVALLVVQKGLTVRETESLVKRLKSSNELSLEQSKEDIKSKNDLLKEYSDYSQNISNKLKGCNVKMVTSGKNKGRIILSFKNNDELSTLKSFFGI